MPKLRPDAKIDIQSAVYFAVEEIICKKEAYVSCLNCSYFREPTEECILAKQRPPARVIAYGCPSYADKYAIPF